MKSISFGLMFILAFSCYFINHRAYAAMYVYPMEVSVGENGASQIKLISQDDNVQFIKVSLKQVVEPGTKQEHEETVDEGGSDSTALIITPQKIALASGSERVIRLVSVTLPQKETTWRAYFENANEDSFLAKNSGNEKEKKSARVGVNIVWGVLVHIAPEKIIPSLKVNKENGKIVNNGTIRIPVKELGVCDNDGQCQWKKTIVTVYPDTEVNIPNTSFSSGKKYRVKYLNWITNKMEEIYLPVLQVN